MTELRATALDKLRTKGVHDLGTITQEDACALLHLLDPSPPASLEWSMERPTDPGSFWLALTSVEPIVIPSIPYLAAVFQDDHLMVWEEGAARSRRLSHGRYDNVLWLRIAEPPEVT